MRRDLFARLSAFAFAALCLLVASPARAQEEGTPKVVDEVIAQVNNEVITLSMLRQEMKDASQALADQRKIPLADAQAEVAKKQAEMIATLINEQLLVQKGKELGYADSVEKEVNDRMVAVMKQEGFKTLEELYAAMRQSGVDPAAVRQQLRTEIMKQAVMQQEVAIKLYWGLTPTELKNYYEAHKDKFRKPESVTLSEIYLSTVGKDEAEVRAHAQAVVAQLRGGADFVATAKAQSERENEKHERTAPNDGGKLGEFVIGENAGADDRVISSADIVAALKGVKVGGVTDPIKLPSDPNNANPGFLILHVDARTPAGEPVYNEENVRRAIASERLDKEQKDYLKKLREDAYVEVASGYREQVMPLLGGGPTAPANTNAQPAPAKGDSKKKDAKSYAGNKKP
ncbi:MAG: peptidyl-prolyl cis-trans isomerase [Acidobacteriota bacterium]|nr:peptidyl-prolyl cis-trans isomerase [Acidobacteriota bacterium]